MLIPCSNALAIIYALSHTAAMRIFKKEKEFIGLCSYHLPTEDLPNLHMHVKLNEILVDYLEQVNVTFLNECVHKPAESPGNYTCTCREQLIVIRADEDFSLSCELRNVKTKRLESASERVVVDQPASQECATAITLPVNPSRAGVTPSMASSRPEPFSTTAVPIPSAGATPLTSGSGQGTTFSTTVPVLNVMAIIIAHCLLS